mmetsp:Transcript_4599/g.9106  ORF Transcript_4599/g.9106 Transcript_4599/m.9106 type:complete len:136 (-) Transcript_4599:1144-1551(-)
MDNLFGAGGAGGGGPEEWFRSLPPITRIWLGSTVIVTGMANLDFVKWADLALARWEDVLGNGVSGKLEAWRSVYSIPECYVYLVTACILFVKNCVRLVLFLLIQCQINNMLPLRWKIWIQCNHRFASNDSNKQSV